MVYYAGLDLSMETTAVCVIDETGRKVLTAAVDSSAVSIAEALAKVSSIDRTVLETGRMSGAICLGLMELGVPIVCIDTRQAHQSLKAMRANKDRPS